uniref:Uncharacterized protein n=1 Tax=Rhizophora mucronata TaxID=61149 RepID=A0A2P2NHK3_RHIMU
MLPILTYDPYSLYFLSYLTQYPINFFLLEISSNFRHLLFIKVFLTFPCK